MWIKLDDIVRGMLGVDAISAVKVTTESFAHELVKDLLNPRAASNKIKRR